MPEKIQHREILWFPKTLWNPLGKHSFLAFREVPEHVIGNTKLFRLRAGSMGTIGKRWFSIRITLTSHVAPADPEHWHWESYGFPDSFKTNSKTLFSTLHGEWEHVCPECGTRKVGRVTKRLQWSTRWLPEKITGGDRIVGYGGLISRHVIWMKVW